MSRPRHNAKPDFDLTGDPGDIQATAVSPDSPAHQEAPSPRLCESSPKLDDGGRSPREVIERHLWQVRHGTVDDDLAENYAENLILLTRWGAPRGHDGMRRFADNLRSDLPHMRLAYEEVLIEDGFGFLEWTGTGPDGTPVGGGADSYVVRGGRIVAQSVHYTVRQAADEENGA